MAKVHVQGRPSRVPPAWAAEVPLSEWALQAQKPLELRTPLHEPRARGARRGDVPCV